MDYIMEAEMLNYETQINMLKEAAYNSRIDESLLTEAFSIKKAWDAFVKWFKEKVGPIIRKLFGWGKEVVASEEKKDKKAKEDIDFILKYQNQMKNAYAGNAIEKKKICFYSLDEGSDDMPIVDIIVKNNLTPLSIHIAALNKRQFTFRTIFGMSDEVFKKEKEDHIKNQEEIDKLKLDSIEKCFRKRELDDNWLTEDSFWLRESMERIVKDKDGIKNSEKNLGMINDMYYSMQKDVNDFDKKYGNTEDNRIKNVIAYGNMIIKEIIDLGTITKTCIELYKKDKDYQYIFLKQVKALMKEALDRGESVEVPNFA